jgi:hypothetical protein
MQLIGRLLNHRSCEVFINFMVGRTNQYLTGPQQAQNMNDLFGMNVQQILADHSDANRVEHLRDKYISQLKSIAGFPYVRWFEMRNRTGHVVYYLLHGTRDVRGVEKMKDAMWKMAPNGDYSFSDRLAGHDVLFQPEPDLQPLKIALFQQFVGRRSIPVNPNLQEWAILETPYRKPHLRQVLDEMEGLSPSPIRVNRPPGKRQFAPGVTVDIL